MIIFHNNKALFSSIIICLSLIIIQDVKGDLACYNACLQSCYILNNIPQKKCPALCHSHCIACKEQVFKSDLVECQLLCRHVDMPQSVCSRSCSADKANRITKELNDYLSKHKITEKDGEELVTGKKIQDPGCEGNGSEYCYKECRLIEEMSVETCKCACCRTEHMNCDDGHH